MAEETDAKKISLQELMVSSLAIADALAKLMMAKGIITDEEFKNPVERRAGELSRCAEAVVLIRPEKISAVAAFLKRFIP